MLLEHKNYALRPYRPNDYETIAKLISHTWEFDTFCTPEVAKLLSYVYLDECIVEQNFATVAVCDDQVAGIIMGDSFCDHQSFDEDILRLKSNKKALESSQEGRDVAKFFDQIVDIDEKLLANTKHNYQGKVELFIVNSAFQGLGLGKKLFSSCLEFFKSKQVQDFYIFTDSSCNVGFYDHAGLKCQGHHPFYYQENGEQQCLNMFIYDNCSNFHQDFTGHTLTNNHGSFLRAV